MPEQPSDSQPHEQAKPPASVDPAPGAGLAAGPRLAKGGGSDLTTVELDEAVRRRHSPRRRTLQIGSAAVLLAVVLGVVVYQLTRTPPAAPETAPPPTVLVSNVSFGTVTLNGKALSGPPPVVLPLQTGVNHISLTALPFAPQSCQLTWGHDALVSIGTCAAEGRDTSVSIGGRSIRPGLIVVLTFSDDDLPAASLARARTAIASVLAGVGLDAVTLAPGESIATGGLFPPQVNTDTASEQIQTNVSFTLPDVVPGAPFPASCDSAGNVICAGAPLARSDYPASSTWAVTLVAAYHWTFRDARGQVVATSMDYPFIPRVAMLLAADGAGGWTVADAPSANAAASGAYGTWAEKLCGAGASVLEANTQAYQGKATVVQDNGIQGCELFVRTNDGTVYRFIWRCGVLLADGALASRLVPGVPVALPAVASSFSG
jgi:hypothetical protein